LKNPKAMAYESTLGNKKASTKPMGAATGTGTVAVAVAVAVTVAVAVVTVVTVVVVLEGLPSCSVVSLSPLQ
jgi:hypothetical protein